MTKYLFTLIILTTSFVFFSCEEDIEPENNQNNNQSMSELILGCWKLDSVRSGGQTNLPPPNYYYWCFNTDSVTSYYLDDSQDNFDIENSHYYIDEFIDVLYNDVDHYGFYQTYPIVSLTNEFLFIKDWSDSLYYSKVESVVW